MSESPWLLSDSEWKLLRHHLVPDAPSLPSRGKPRLDNTREAAQACLYRYYHQRASSYRCFGWHQLPEELGITPNTANRRYREWVASGDWACFWDALVSLRQQKPPEPNPAELQKRSWGSFPGGDLILELERSYRFFNTFFFADALPAAVITLERMGLNRKGMFCPAQWASEQRTLGHVVLSTELIPLGAEEVLQTLLHEMVHLRNHQVGVEDCSPQQYHNRFFRDAAHLIGLEVRPRDPRFGYAYIDLGERARGAVNQLKPREELFCWELERGIDQILSVAD